MRKDGGTKSKPDLERVADAVDSVDVVTCCAGTVGATTALPKSISSSLPIPNPTTILGPPNNSPKLSLNKGGVVTLPIK